MITQIEHAPIRTNISINYLGNFVFLLRKICINYTVLFKFHPLTRFLFSNKLLLTLLIYSGITSAQVTFDEVANNLGMSFPTENTESLAWGDYDNDGDDDVYLAVDGANAFMRNNGDGTFTNVIDSSGAQDSSWSVGATFADFDNDGDLDLFFVNFGSASDALFRNNGEENNFTFTNVAQSAGLTNNTSSSRGVTLIDYDRDGLIDIYVNAIGPNLLYKNLGNLVFSEVAANIGVDAEGTGVGSVASDIDNNGWIDLFTSNRSLDPNRLYFNSDNGFTDVSANGIDKVGLGMGVVSFDYDNDLDMDLYWTTWPGSSSTANAFYQNQQNQFVDVALLTQTQDISGWGISANVADIDNDGWLDLLVSNGFSSKSSDNVLFHNQLSTNVSAFEKINMGMFDGRGVAFSDYDNDGDMDVLITGGPGVANHFFKNTTSTLNQWLQIKLLGTMSNKSAIGARVEVTSNRGVSVQEVSGGAGRGSQNSLTLGFGLGDATQIESIAVRWPNGNQQNYNYHGAVNRKIILIEDVLFASSFENSSTNISLANVISVTTTGLNNNYTFSVGILSPDVSCVQYADWWEVLDNNGMIHRRILGHSHANEQPFIRSSGSINVSSNKTIWIRAHMSNGGYGGTMLTGSVQDGFNVISYANLWDDAIEFLVPQVNDCAF